MIVGRPEYNRIKIIEDIVEVMKLEPFISLNELSKRVKHSPPTITNIYSKVRRSSEWKEWVRNHENNRVDLREDREIDETVIHSDLRG